MSTDENNDATQDNQEEKGRDGDEKSDVFDSNNPPGDMWMLRDCRNYLAEYDNCQSWRGRISQVYITGEKEDCSKWKEMYNSCSTFIQTRSMKALDKVLEQERKQYFRRIKGSLDNDVWEKRTSPPEDWGQPVAEGWMEERTNTVLDAAQREDSTMEKILRRPRCVIL